MDFIRHQVIYSRKTQTEAYLSGTQKTRVNVRTSFLIVIKHRQYLSNLGCCLHFIHGHEYKCMYAWQKGVGWWDQRGIRVSVRGRWGQRGQIPTSTLQLRQKSWQSSRDHRGHAVLRQNNIIAACREHGTTYLSTAHLWASLQTRLNRLSAHTFIISMLVYWHIHTHSTSLCHDPARLLGSLRFIFYNIKVYWRS